MLFRVETAVGMAKCRLFPQEMESFSIDDGDRRFFKLFAFIPGRQKFKM